MELRKKNKNKNICRFKWEKQPVIPRFTVTPAAAAAQDLKVRIDDPAGLLRLLAGARQAARREPTARRELLRVSSAFFLIFACR